MAARKFSPFPVLKQPKQPVYEALYKLNLAFESLAVEIERLDESEAIPFSTLKLYRTMAEELRSAINSRITEVLHTRELKDWGHFGKLKIQQEAKLKVTK